MNKYDAVVFIGRFQPFHTAHAKILDQAFELGNHVFITIGSSYRARTYKNPFTHIERSEIIETYLNQKKIYSDRYSFIWSEDLRTDDEWADQIFNEVNCKFNTYTSSVAIIGHKKDSSSYYIDLFPSWHVIEVESLNAGLSATKIRDVYFNSDLDVTFEVPSPTTDFLVNFKKTPHFQKIVQEHKKLEEYQKPYLNLPFPPTFVTADAVVRANDEFLLITRKFSPGKGLFALPGGFLNASTDVSIESAMFRELKEETGIVLPKETIKDSKVFDELSRSSRGRTITHAFYSELNYRPTANASDDAEGIHWLSWNAIYNNRESFFEDHYLIIKYFYDRHF
jgi:bifunctional NMN adenylyltransferase/nudix hydrolase